MATLEIEGFDELNEALRRIGTIPEAVTVKALDAMAQVAAAKIKASGESMGVRDPESSVHVLDVIKPTKAKKTPEGGYEDITFSGTRRRSGKRVRNAEIAFVNEYGTRNQRARPFIGQAMTQNEAAIAAPGAEIIGDWIEHEFSK